jgi:hypothetical protein
VWYRPPVSDEPGGTDDRSRRRMGDATKGRIADLASGWEVPPEAKGAAAEPAPPPVKVPPQPAVAGELPRPKSRTSPPPPPGSPMRTKPPTESVPTLDPVALPLPAPPTSSPPSPPPARKKPPSKPPAPPPPRGRPAPAPVGDEDELTRPADPPAGLGPPPALGASGFASEQRASVKPDPQKGVMKRILDATPIPGPEMRHPGGQASAPAHRPSSPGFDAPQATVVDDAPAGLRPDPPAAVVAGPRGVRGDATVVPTGEDGERPVWHGDPSQISTSPFERGDPTGVTKDSDSDAAEPEVRGDQTQAQVHAQQAALNLTQAISLRDGVTLPRRRGVLGDVRYVFTVLFGVRRAKREAVTVGAAIARQLAERKERLVALGRAAIVSERFDHPALTAARERLAEIEEERSKHAGSVAAAEEELEHVRRERAKRAAQYAADVAALESDLASIAGKLAPLQKESVVARRRAGDLAEQLKRIDSKIRKTEGLLTNIQTKKEDRAAVLAEVATFKADRLAIQRDAPAISAELDRLAPKMASLEAKTHDAQAKLVDLKEEELVDQKRAEELVAAIEAKRKVVMRSQTDAEKTRDKALHGLAERLLVDRPSQLGRAFEPIDELDLQIATSERRAMELRELLSSVDRGAMARGIAVMVVIVGAAAAGVVLALTQSI